MSITTHDLDAFHEFAVGKLQNGGAKSLTELAAEWEAARELEQSVSGIRQSMVDADAAPLIPAEQAFAEARRKLGPAE